MAVIETWYNQDLQEPVKVHYLDGNMFSHNGNGNRIGVNVFNNGEAVTLSGTVSGYVVTADGSTVPCTGSRSGNKASILIPAAAYQPGSVFITLFLTDGKTVTTLASVSTSVLTARTNNQVSPGSVVTDWTQTINGAMQDVQTAAENLGGIVATPYASLTFPVPLGKYTYYNGNLYRCISPIATSESFTAAHWTQVRLGDDVSDLKSALVSIADEQVIYAYSGNISGTRQVNATGLSIPAGTYIFTADVSSTDTDNNTCRVIFVKNNSTVTNVYAQRISGYTTTVTLSSDVDEIRFFAANSYNDGAGDTFSFTNVKLYAETNLKMELESAIKYIGRSNDVGLTDANNAIKGSIYSIANGVVISNLPSFNTEGVLLTTKGNFPVQIFFVDGVFYKRYLRGSAWTDWKTDETPNFVFKGRSNSVGLTDANNAGKNTVYNTAGTVVMENLPYSTNEGVLITTGGDFPVQLYFVNDGFYKRYYRGSTNGWSTWVNTGVEIETTPSNLIENIKKYNGTGVTLRLSNETFDIISIYKAYYGNDWFDNYTGWNGNPDPFTRGLYITGIKLKGRANTKFVMSADTGNTAVKTHFSIFAPYTDVELEDFTIDIGNGFCRYCIHDDFAPQNCKMVYRNLVMIGSSYNANALYGMGCGSNVIYEFDRCWMMSGTSRAWYGHSAPNQTKPCIVKISDCVSYQNIGFKWYSNYSGMNIGYVDKSVQNVTCDAYYDAQVINFNVYHDTGSEIELLPAS